MHSEKYDLPKRIESDLALLAEKFTVLTKASEQDLENEFIIISKYIPEFQKMENAVNDRYGDVLGKI
ncbi:hypothetical protein [Anaerovibrio sp.]|uniref:hypothetical protein n=1 Tax=Anaerovibrio sp. TaxID=1872532 RepID=UPI00388F08AD